MGDQDSRPAPAVGSPCVGICVLDDTGGHCVGCLRTLEEIAGWPGYSDAERLRVLDSLALRGRSDDARDSPGAGP